MRQPAQSIFYFCVRLVARLALSRSYRLRSDASDRIPAEGAALLVANHVSLIDAIVIGVLCRRRIRFVMDHRIHRHPALSWLFRGIGAIPIASAKSDPARMERAFERIDRALQAGEVVCIFPEGRLSRDGALDRFRPGVERILARRPVPVVPLALGGLWGSLFSYRDGLLRGGMRRGRPTIDVLVGQPIDAARATAARLHAAVLALKAPLSA